MLDHCTHLDELLEVQKDFIKKHIERHKWFNHIADKNEAIGDFINKYAWLLREVYCGYTCPERSTCEIAQEYLPKQAESVLAEFLEVQKDFIKKHIERHKWFNHIADEQKAIGDFINKYAWLLREVYCGYTCPKRWNCEIAQEYLPKQAKSA